MPSPMEEKKQSSHMRLAMMLDITGSMGSQLEGAKKMLAQLVSLIETSGIHMQIVVIPFTETSAKHGGCLASKHVFEDPSKASTFINSLKLCRSPLCPKISASGEDGPENAKAALWLLTELDPMPTIGFLVTDAVPHFRDVQSPTAKCELQWLADRNVVAEVRTDVFRLFKAIDEYYNGMLILNSILYSTNSNAQAVYGRMAQATGGMLMRPTSSHAELLSQGLMTVLGSLIARIGGEWVQEEELSGFDLYDVNDLSPVESELEERGAPPERGDVHELFESSMIRAATVVSGKKWGKRAFAMSAAVEQMKFVWYTAKYLTKPAAERTDKDLAEILTLHTFITEVIPKKQRGQFNITTANLEKKLKEVCFEIEQGEGVESIITLETVGDALDEEADASDWLKTVMGLIVGFPVKVQLPLDVHGQPDFMDSWASVCDKVGVDRMTAKDFVQLVGKTKEGVVVGPTDSGEYNCFLAMVPKEDKIASLILWLMSGTQLLNTIQSVTMGASGFLPNLYAGTASACFTKMIMREELSEFQRKQLTEILHSLRLLNTSPAPDVAQQLRRGHGNPADCMSKYVAVLARMENKPSFPAALELVAEEWLAMLVQKYYGKLTPENNKRYLEEIENYFPASEVIVGGMQTDPMLALNVLEMDKITDASMQSEWLERSMRRLKSHPVKKYFEKDMVTLISILSGKPIEAIKELEVVKDVNGKLAHAILWRMRTARYTSVTDESNTVTFTPLLKADLPTQKSLVLRKLKKAHRETLVGFKNARRNAMKAALVEAVLCALRKAKDEEHMIATLSTLYLPMDKNEDKKTRPKGIPIGPTATILGITFKLGRMEVPELLQRFKKVEKRVEVVKPLVCGLWTTDPPAALKRHLTDIVASLGNCDVGLVNELESAVKKNMLCMRVHGYNRLGHCANYPYPGADGWTLDYAKERTKGLRNKGVKEAAITKRRKYLEQMKKYTAFTKWATELGVQAGVLKDVQALLTKYEDANLLYKVARDVEKVLGVLYAGDKTGYSRAEKRPKKRVGRL